MTAISLRVDDKGRVTLPKKLREKMNLVKGDTLFLHEGKAEIILKKGIDPFDAIVKEGLKEYKEGKTTSLDDFASEMGINLD